MGTGLTDPEVRLEAALRAAEQGVSRMGGWGVLRAMAARHDGMCPYWQGRQLLQLAAASLPGAIVEIGSWKGGSACWLGWGSQIGPRNPVFCVDGFSDPSGGEDPAAIARGEAKGFSVLPEFERNVQAAGVANLVTPVVAWSPAAAEGWTEPISLLYLDGMHTREALEADLAAWTQHLVDGAIVAFDDVNPRRFPGVVEVVETLRQLSTHWTERGQAGRDGRMVWGTWVR